MGMVEEMAGVVGMYKNHIATNTARIQLEWQLNHYGQKYTLFEPLYTSDGANGKLQSGEKRHEVKAIFVNGSVSGRQMQTDDGYRRRGGSAVTPYLLVLYDKKIRPEYLTKTWGQDGRVYEIVDWNNVDSLNVYWRFALRSTEKYMERYDNHGRPDNG